MRFNYLFATLVGGLLQLHAVHAQYFSKTYQEPLDFTSSVNELKVLPDGTMLAASGHEVLRISANGDKLWSVEFYAPDYSELQFLHPLANGNWMAIGGNYKTDYFQEFKLDGSHVRYEELGTTQDVQSFVRGSYFSEGTTYMLRETRFQEGNPEWQLVSVDEEGVFSFGEPFYIPSDENIRYVSGHNGSLYVTWNKSGKIQLGKYDISTGDFAQSEVAVEGAFAQTILATGQGIFIGGIKNTDAWMAKVELNGSISAENTYHLKFAEQILRIAEFNGDGGGFVVAGTMGIDLQVDPYNTPTETFVARILPDLSKGFVTKAGGKLGNDFIYVLFSTQEAIYVAGGIDHPVDVERAPFIMKGSLDGQFVPALPEHLEPVQIEFMPWGNRQHVNDAIQGPDDSYLIGGYRNQGESATKIAAYGSFNRFGQLVWKKEILEDLVTPWNLTPQEVQQEILRIVRAADGGYFLLGKGKVLSDIGFVMKTDVNGNKQWSTTIPAGLSTYIGDIALLSNGNILVAGSVSADLSDVNVFVAILDPSTGEIIKYDELNAGGFDYVKRIIPLEDSFLLFGHNVHSFDILSDLHIHQFSNEGNFINSKLVETAPIDLITDAVAVSAVEVKFVGHRGDLSGELNIFTGSFILNDWIVTTQDQGRDDSSRATQIVFREDTKETFLILEQGRNLVGPQSTFATVWNLNADTNIDFGQHGHSHSIAKAIALPHERLIFFGNKTQNFQSDLISIHQLLGKMNLLPQLENPIADQYLQEGFESQSIDLTGVFSDSDGDPLTLSAYVNFEDIVTVELAGNTLTINEQGIGNALVTVVADDGNGGIVFDSFIVGVATITSTNDKIESLTLFPNPATDLISVKTDNDMEGSFTLYSLSGQTMMEAAIPAGGAQLNVSNLPKGIYIAKVVSGGIQYTGRLLIK